jgi:MFS family permease
MTSTTAFAQVEADPAMHGRVLALQTVLMVGTTPIGGPLLGWLADTVGSRAPIVLGGVVALGTAAFGALAARRWVDESALAGLPAGARPEPVPVPAVPAVADVEG